MASHTTVTLSERGPAGVAMDNASTVASALPLPSSRTDTVDTPAGLSTSTVDNSNTTGPRGLDSLYGQCNIACTPLHPWQTRLVELLPGSFDDSSIKCNLVAADIILAEGLGVPARSRIQVYGALSYSWGHPERTATVSCNGVSVKIPPALAKALLYLRYPSQSRWL